MFRIKNKRVYIIFFTLFIMTFILGCESKKTEKFNYRNNYQVVKEENVIKIISNRDFKNAEFLVSPIIYNKQVNEIDPNRKIKITNNQKTQNSVISVVDNKNGIKAGDTILIIKTDKDLTINLKQKYFIAKFFETILIELYLIVKNFGIAIILITILIKLIMLPFTLKMDKSMRGMKKIQPQVEQLKKKYKDNSAKLNEEMMKLWKEHNVNPIGGCLPAILQIPIFFALYSILKTDSLSTIIPVDSKFLYLNLTKADPLYILPILNGVILFVQQQVIKTEDTNPQTKMLQYILPFMMLIISLKMPSGVQLYWVFSTLFSFLQQYYIVKISNEN